MKLEIKELKEIMSKISLAVEKSKINPKSSWIEIETVDGKLNFRVANFDYYLETSVNIPQEQTNETLHVTISADTFIPLISKLDCDVVYVSEKFNALYLESENGEYNFPVIKELGKTKSVDKIDCKATSQAITLNGEDLSSVALTNTNGLLNAIISKDIQQYIYIDELGAITFTENIYVNTFNHNCDGHFKALLTVTQAKLLEIFEGIEKVNLEVENEDTFSDVPTKTNKLHFYTDNIDLILVTQNIDKVEKFPCIKLRVLSDNPEQTHVVIDKKQLDKALARLMIFDKKFDITVMDYSKLIFKEDGLELVSVKNKNSEKLKYISSQNVVEHESMIRFADLVKQLKAITSKEVDISYGSRPAIVLNGNVKQLIPEIRVVSKV